MFSWLEIYLIGVLFSYASILISMFIYEEEMKRFNAFYVLLFVIVFIVFSWFGLVGLVTYQIYRKFKK